MPKNKTALRRMIQIRHVSVILMEEDEPAMRELQKEIGGFSIIRREDWPTINVRGKALTRLEVRFDHPASGE